MHKIIQNLTDISEGVVDVVESSKAKYLEIRTTPKEMAHETRDKYIDSFVFGLLQANQKITDKKTVELLSLGRTLHNLEDALYFIDLLLNKKVALTMLGNSYRSMPQLPQQDDESIFGASAKAELNKFLGFFK